MPQPHTGELVPSGKQLWTFDKSGNLIVAGNIYTGGVPDQTKPGPGQALVPGQPVGPPAGQGLLAGLLPSGDVSGATDPGNITALSNLGALDIVLTAGAWFVGAGAGAVQVAAGARVRGAGEGATIVTIAAGFAGGQVFNATSGGGYITISDMSIVGASATITNNPACDAIALNGGRNNRVERVFFQYINGWCINSIATAQNAGFATMIECISILQCAGGIHIQGVAGTGWGAQHNLTDISAQQVGVAFGGTANRDCLMLEDAFDVLIENFNGAIAGAGQSYGPGNVNSGGFGSTFHVKGKCSTVRLNNGDLGCFPNAAGISNSCYLIETSGNGNPLDIRISDSVGQQSGTGVTVSAGSNIKFDNCTFVTNYGHGGVVSGSGSDIMFIECRFGGNGANASGTNYDLNWSGTATGFVRGTSFLSPIVLVGNSGVQNSVNIAAKQDVQFTNSPFRGAGATGFSSAFTNVPSVVRNCPGCNPKGAVTVNVPGTGNSTSSLGFDAYFYITANAGASCTVQRSGSGPSVVIPAAQLGTVFVPAGQTLTYTYTAVPTQVVDGQ